ncbi:MAG: YceH family protein [Pirellulaceae bacterium]
MQDESDYNSPKWKPLEKIERRVLAVLIEKAKTTPDNYPMTIAALTTGCNQKSARDPVMQLDNDDVEIALQTLRAVGVCVEVQGQGRTSKFRHLAYDWFDVKGPEIAVLTELLLRGPQTIGELRSRASRMEPFADVAALQPVLDLLESKKLVVPLTPPGRGQLFSHTLYPSQEFDSLKRRAGASLDSFDPPSRPEPGTDVQAAADVANTMQRPAAQSEPSVSTGRAQNNVQADVSGELAELREQVRLLGQEINELKQRLDFLES